MEGKTVAHLIEIEGFAFTIYFSKNGGIHDVN
jgi:hypothetical protein